MKKNKKIKIFIGIFAVLFLSLIPSISAHCPLCTAGAAAGVGVARFYGVDDSIVGLLLGAFIVSSALWFNKWLIKKKINFQFQETILVVASFLLLAVPLYSAGIITDFEMVKSMPEHHSMLGMGIYGIDKLLFGMVTGSIIIWNVFGFSERIKRKKGKVLFPYQGLSFMMFALAILSAAFWLITK